MDILEKAFFTYLNEHFRGLQDGTAKEPSVLVGGETNSGFYRMGDCKLGLSDNGEHAFTITPYSTLNVNSICLDMQVNHRQLLVFFEAAVKKANRDKL